MNVVAVIKPYLLLGSAGSRTEQFLRSNKVTLVINAAHNNPSTESCIVPQIKLKSEDHPSYNLKSHFNEVADKIDAEVKADGKVFVHCISGISRAPSLVMAYLMKYESMTLYDAHSLLLSQRKFVRPNLGFWKQLIEFEYEITGKNTVTIDKHKKTEYASVYKSQYVNMVPI